MTTPAVWQRYLHECRATVARASAWSVSGRLVRVTGLVLEAEGLRLPVGEACRVVGPDGHSVEAEVVGFSGERLLLMPSSDTWGLEPGALVFRLQGEAVVPVFGRPGAASPAPGAGRRVGVGHALLGRVVDADGQPLDGLGPVAFEDEAPLQGRLMNPLERAPIDAVLDVGVRAINGLLTVGRGQRLGLFAGSGVGKSVLLGMMARYTSADVVVVGLIGERGREVKEFITHILGPEGLARAAVVAAPADSPPLLRLRGAAYATAIAEHFRARGRHVLLIMDSLTRFAMAQRELSLAAGEPPATKGYPPSVFARLPQLVERAGNGTEGGGSITAFYTVLTEGDDPQDPVADSARAILDGHIVLSRDLADLAHYPAIDVESSISRAMTEIVGERDMALVRRFRRLYGSLRRSRDLINVGAYVAGADPVVDEALRLQERMLAFLRQDVRERSAYDASRASLAAVLADAAVA